MFFSFGIEMFLVLLNVGYSLEGRREVKGVDLVCWRV